MVTSAHMPLYELSIDASHLRDAEAIVSLEGRGYPTLVIQWESQLFGQAWTTTIVLDYILPLPPLLIGQATFNEVRIAAFTGGAPTKFLYFGTEMNASVPRVAPEMENRIGAAADYQEFRLEESSCPLPYLKLIQATPRIYGNGAQDYYSPPIRVERYDGAASPDHVADFFPTVVAGLESVSGAILADPSRGFWTGSRYMGTTRIAILRQGKVVGVHSRIGKSDKDALPRDVKSRDPRLDVLREWVAVDIGMASTSVGVRPERGQPELIRLGPAAPIRHSSDYENPSEIAFDNLGRALKAWRERVIFPLTRWEDVVVGHAARAFRSVSPDVAVRTRATLTGLTTVRDRVDNKEATRLCGRTDPDTNESLKKPAPPIIDEDGIGGNDPFDPIELYAYHVGLAVNHRSRGVHVRYAVTMPTGWSQARRDSVLIAFRRGFYRSLPAGLVDYHDVERLEVIDAGPAAIPFAVQAFRAFGVQPRGEAIPFAVVDAGASETGLAFGNYRLAKSDERALGHERVIEHIEPASVPALGGERLLHRLAYQVYGGVAELVAERRIPFELPSGEQPLAALEDLLTTTPEARANTVIFKDALRGVLEGDVTSRLPSSVRLLNDAGAPVDLPIEPERAELIASLQRWIGEGVEAVAALLAEAVQKIGRDPDPYEGLHLFIGGRLGTHAYFNERLSSAIPSKVAIHRFKEPESTNLAAPTVKTATVLGVLTMKAERVIAIPRQDERTSFRFRVGRARHGQLSTALDPSSEYDAWCEIGACSKPEVDVLYMPASADDEVPADDPRITKIACTFPAAAVGQRLYLRATGPTSVELGAGPPGGEPDASLERWLIDLERGTAARA